MNDRPRPFLPRGGVNHILNVASARSGRHIKKRTLEMWKGTGQDRLGRIDLRARNHVVVDAYQTAVAVQRIRNRECIAHRCDISVDEDYPDNYGTNRPIPASDDVVGDESGPLIAK